MRWISAILFIAMTPFANLLAQEVVGALPDSVNVATKEIVDPIHVNSQHDANAVDLRQRAEYEINLTRTPVDTPPLQFTVGRLVPNLGHFNIAYESRSLPGLLGSEQLQASMGMKTKRAMV